jgi:hypothetical protein
MGQCETIITTYWAMQLHIAEELNSIKLPQATSCVTGSKGELNDVWRTNCAVIIMRTEMVLITSVHSPFDHLAQLLARESFTEFCR